MTASARPWAAAAAVCGALAVILCAFASHGVEDPQHAFWLRIGGFCLLVHANAALVTLALVRDRLGRVTASLFLGGGVIFAATLAGMTLGGPHWLGAVTPFGGLLMIFGWLALAWAFVRPLPDDGKNVDGQGA